jgi:hypothetical protein
MDNQWHHQSVKGWKHFGIHPIVSISAIVCANSECRELTLNAILGRSNPSRDDAVEGPYKTWTLLPPSSARPQPDYIPKAIRDDYYEACAICELSPKASATVIRRCLQGVRHLRTQPQSIGYGNKALPARHDPRLLRHIKEESCR